MEELNPTPFTFRQPHDMVSRIEKRWKNQEYPSKNAYLVGLVLYDLMCKCPHKVTAELMNKPQYIRDMLIREICEAFDSKEPKPPQWLKKRLLELANQIPDIDEKSKGSENAP